MTTDESAERARKIINAWLVDHRNAPTLDDLQDLVVAALRAAEQPANALLTIEEIYTVSCQSFPTKCDRENKYGPAGCRQLNCHSRAQALLQRFKLGREFAEQPAPEKGETPRLCPTCGFLHDKITCPAEAPHPADAGSGEDAEFAREWQLNEKFRREHARLSSELSAAREQAEERYSALKLSYDLAYKHWHEWRTRAREQIAETQRLELTLKGAKVLLDRGQVRSRVRGGS